VESDFEVILENARSVLDSLWHIGLLRSRRSRVAGGKDRGGGSASSEASCLSRVR
jgi:hypothetical protein